MFKFISLVSKKSGIAELVVYKREKKIDLNEDTIKHCLRTGLAKLYSFPRTEVNKGLEIEQNRICNVDLTADGDYDVYVSETGNINNCWENEALRYKFDKNFNLKQIEYSEKFNTTYQKLQSENKINISVSVENHLSNIKSEFKGINK
ncbi:MAG: hypothetical protein NTU73_14175 [Ignavibacteriae bacterium]|nr:hypothetical protein [Ignavibacteriota bacterium]